MDNALGYDMQLEFRKGVAVYDYELLLALSMFWM